MNFTTILLIIFVLSAIICHILAKKYGAKSVFWGVMGLTFGPFAIISLIFFAKKPRYISGD